MKDRKLIYLIAFIAFFLLAGLFVRKRLRNTHKIASAIITDCYWGARGTGKFILEAHFSIGDKDFKTTSLVPCTKMSLTELQVQCLNKIVPIVYDPTFPSLNTLIVERSMAIRYQVPFPDSLNNLSKFLNCE